MLVTLLIPVNAISLGIMFLDEPIRFQEIAGALIIGLGLLFIDGGCRAGLTSDSRQFTRYSCCQLWKYRELGKWSCWTVQAVMFAQGRTFIGGPEEAAVL